MDIGIGTVHHRFDASDIGTGRTDMILRDFPCRARGRRAGGATRERFWETVPLAEMTGEEWEALCDGCGQCCLLKLEDEDTREVHYTNVTCRLFDAKTRRCGDYARRRQLVPGCVTLTPETLPEAASWMPASCAYRRLHAGRGLAAWHPPISGGCERVVEAGVAVAQPLIPESEIDCDDPDALLAQVVADDRMIDPS